MTESEPLKGKQHIEKGILCHKDKDIRSAVELRKERLGMLLTSISATTCSSPEMASMQTHFINSLGDLINKLDNDFEDVMKE